MNTVQDNGATEKKAFIPALGYSFLTAWYDLAIKLTMPERKFRGKLVDELDPKDGETILEFGFGTAQNLILAFQRNHKAVLAGLDIDPAINSIAAHKLGKLGYDIALHLYDGTTFPFANNSFDKVFSSLVFHQLDRETKLACIKEIFRVLKPGGALVVGDWGKARNRAARLSFYLVQILDGCKTTSDNVNGLLPLFIEQGGFQNVTESGFINTKIGTFSYYKARKPVKPTFVD